MTSPTRPFLVPRGRAADIDGRTLLLGSAQLLGVNDVEQLFA